MRGSFSKGSGIAALACIAVALTGCGGGGGDAGAAPAAAAPKLDAGTAPAVTSRAYSATSAIYSSGAFTAEALKSADAGDPVARLNLAETATRQLLRLADASSGAVATKAVVTQTQACPGGGSLTVTLTDADNSESLTSGDSGAFTYARCSLAGVVLDGTFSFSSLAIAGSDASTTRSITASFAFDRFGATSGSETGSVTGDLTIQATVRNVAPITLDITVSGSQLTVSRATRSETLTAYTGRLLVDTSADTYSYAVSGTMTGTGLPGAIVVTTPTPFTGTVDASPSAGRLLATASGGESARLTATSPTAVTLDVDADADGQYESTRSLTWAQVIAL